MADSAGSGRGTLVNLGSEQVGVGVTMRCHSLPACQDRAADSKAGTVPRNRLGGLRIALVQKQFAETK